MTSAKVSFAINQKEGLAELRRRQDEAGVSSLGLYVKQLVLDHLAHDDDDRFSQLADAIEQLRHAVLQSAKQSTDTSRRIDCLPTTNSFGEKIDALRHDFASTLLALLQERHPLTREQAEQVVRQVLGGGNERIAFAERRR